MGGYKIQGKTEESAQRLLEEAHNAEDAGAFSVLLEAIPMGLAQKITEEISVPTIGIGAGPFCDGQVLVLHDVIGLFERFLPKFAKRYTNLRDEALNAIRLYREEVEKGIFPSKDQSFK
jgi:3-methyl-2-oxobutanoate hydroxymethyltransferase